MGIFLKSGMHARTEPQHNYTVRTNNLQTKLPTKTRNIFKLEIFCMSKFPNFRLEKLALASRYGSEAKANAISAKREMASVLVSPYSVKGFAGFVVARLRCAAQ